MDSVSPIIPSPSTGWGRPAATQGEPSGIISMPSSQSSQRHDEDAAQLKARLLRLIVANEHTRKSAAAEAQNARYGQ